MPKVFRASFEGVRSDHLDVLAEYGNSSSYDQKTGVLQLAFESARLRDIKLQSMWAIEHRCPMRVWDEGTD
jgi:hypothetical protein